MQAAFFKLAEIIPFEEAQQYMKDYAKKSYAKKGDEIVQLNYNAIDRGANDIVEIEVDPAWANLEATALNEPKETAGCGGCCASVPDFVKNIAKPINAIKGNDLPVSAFLGYEDGTFEMVLLLLKREELLLMYLYGI